MSSFFLKIVNMSIAASWLILAVVLLRVVLKKAPKWINVLLWGIVAFRLICPFSFESALSLIPSAETISPEIMMDWTPEISTGVSSIDKVVNPIITDTFAPEPIASANPLQLLIPVLAIVWAIGIIAMLVYAAVSYFRLQKKVGASLSVRDNIWICDDIQTPFILGFFKPSIYIPSGTDEAQLPYIIAHENAHLKRCDHWWKPLGYLVLAIHWFNPLVWIAYILLCRDIELACDEKVIRGLNQNESISYSEALLSCSVNRRTVMVCPLAFGEVGVKERVKNVLNYKKPAFWIVAIAVVASIVLGVCFLTNPSSFPVKLDSVQISKASTMDFRTNIGPTTFQLSAAEIDELRRKLEHMNEVFANAQRVRFGQSSEKNSYVLHDQASFFNEAEKEQAPKAEEPTPDTILVPQHERKKKRSQAEVLNGLPEEEVLLKLPEYQLVYGKCGGKMKPIGKKFLRHEMQIIPKQIKLLAYYAVTYACDSCEKDTGFAHIVTVKPPVPLMKHSLASPSTVASFMPWAPYIQQEFGVKNSDAYVNTHLD